MFKSSENTKDRIFFSIHQYIANLQCDQLPVGVILSSVGRALNLCYVLIMFKSVNQSTNQWIACSAGVFWTRECTFSYLGRHLGFGNCGGLGRGNIS